MRTKLFRKYIGTLLVAFFAAAFLSAQTPLVPDSRITSILSALSADPSARMDPTVFARLALIASGSDQNRTDVLLGRLSSLSAELNAGLPPEADARTKSEAVLALMYKKVLTRYSEFQTRVDTALESGDYNCVSSALLFYYFAETTGLSVEGVETPDHAFCTVVVNGVKIDVETTNPYGFDPGSQKELQTNSAEQKKYVFMPLTKYRDRQPASERRFLSLVYGNRISLLERRGDFVQAVGFALDSHTLQGTEASFTDLAERFITYAVNLSDRGREGEGLDFIIAMSDRFGTYPRYAEYISSAAGMIENALMKKNDYPGGFAFLDKYAPRIEKARYDEMFRLLNVNYLGYTIENSGMQDALPVIYGSRQYLSPADFERLIVLVYSREAEKIARTGKWLETVAVLDLGLKEIPGQKDLLLQRTMYRQNYAIGVHNEAVKAWNAGGRASVKTLIEDALALIPESTLLQNDLKNMK